VSTCAAAPLRQPDALRRIAAVVVTAPPSRVLERIVSRKSPCGDTVEQGVEAISPQRGKAVALRSGTYKYSRHRHKKRVLAERLEPLMSDRCRCTLVTSGLISRRSCTASFPLDTSSLARPQNCTIGRVLPTSAPADCDLRCGHVTCRSSNCAVRCPGRRANAR
jgi:hypothetical protein